MNISLWSFSLSIVLNLQARSDGGMRANYIERTILGGQLPHCTNKGKHCGKQY